MGIIPKLMERQINKMLAEYPENDPLCLGADRLGPLCGRSGPADRLFKSFPEGIEGFELAGTRTQNQRLKSTLACRERS